MEENKNPIDRSNEKLMDPETSLNDLLHALSRMAIVAESEQVEQEEKKRESEKARLKEVLGADYRAFYEGSPSTNRKKTRRRPGAVQLRNEALRIAVKQVGTSVLCEAFVNGYAIYDNGNRKTVVWLADCTSVTYSFTKLRDNEKQYQLEKDTVGKDVLGPVPWYIAVSIRGEGIIERNMPHPKSLGTMSDSEKLEEWELKGNPRWIAGSHFENPEDAYIRKEYFKEHRRFLAEKQDQVINLYHFEGYTQEEIARELGMTQPAVSKLLDRAYTRWREFEKNY